MESKRKDALSELYRAGQSASDTIIWVTGYFKSTVYIAPLQS